MSVSNTTQRVKDVRSEERGHPLLPSRKRTSRKRTRTAMTSFGKVINVRRDDYAITAIAVCFAGPITELETI